METDNYMFDYGDKVRSKGSDSNFVGIIVAVFTKFDGVTRRVVVENPDRILHIFAEKHLEKVQP